MVCVAAVFWAFNVGAYGRFEVPASCGSRAEFETSIRTRLGDDATKLLETLELLILAEQDEYRLSMRIGNERRVLEDSNCRDLFRAAVVVAIALWEAPSSPHVGADSSSSSQPDSNDPVDPVKEAAPPRAGRQVEARTLGGGILSLPTGRVDVKEEDRPRGLSWSLSLQLGVGRGTQPDLAPNLGVRATTGFERFGISTTLRFAPRDTTKDTNQRGVAVTAASAQLAGFWLPLNRLALELGASAGYLHGQGLGSTQVGAASVFALGPMIAVWGIPWESGSTFVALGTESHINLLRPRFEISGYGEVFRVHPISWNAYFSAGLRFR